jgi:hypothetical protein
MSEHDGLKACIAEVIGPLTNVVAGLSSDFKAQVDSNNKAIEKILGITQTLQNNLDQIRKDREIFEAKIEEQILAIQAQQQAQQSSVEQLHNTMKNDIEQVRAEAAASKARRVGSPPPQGDSPMPPASSSPGPSGSASTSWRPVAHFGPAQNGTASTSAQDTRPNTLEIKGFERGHYPSIYEKHWNDIKILLDDDLAAKATPVFPYGKPFYRIKFESFSDAILAKEALKDIQYHDEQRD